jgi:hypothetical protein
MASIDSLKASTKGYDRGNCRHGNVGVGQVIIAKSVLGEIALFEHGKGEVGVNEVGVGVIMASVESWKTSTNRYDRGSCMHVKDDRVQPNVVKVA